MEEEVNKSLLSPSSPIVMKMREYYDLIVHSEEIDRKLKEIGFVSTGYGKFKILDKDPKKFDPKKINLFFPKNKNEIVKITRKHKKFIYGFINPLDTKILTPSMMRIIKEANMSIIITLDYLTEYRNKHQLFRSLSFLGKLVNKFKINLIISSGSRNIYDIKSPRQLANIGYFLGLNQMQCLNTISINVKYLVDIYENNI